MPKLTESRLFVPLATEPYSWFISGHKCWELRKQRGQYSGKHVYPLRYVELRKGYTDAFTSLYGRIAEVIEKKSIQEVLEKIPYKEIIPIAESKDRAIQMAENITGNVNGYIAFRIDLLRECDYSQFIRFERRYLDQVNSLSKRSTIRRSGSVHVGPYLFDFEGERIKAFVTKIIIKRFCEISIEDANQDGFAKVEELHEVLLMYYPDTSQNTPFSLCSFNMVNKCHIQ